MTSQCQGEISTPASSLTSLGDQREPHPNCRQNGLEKINSKEPGEGNAVVIPRMVNSRILIALQSLDDSRSREEFESGGAAIVASVIGSHSVTAVYCSLAVA